MRNNQGQLCRISFSLCLLLTTACGNELAKIQSAEAAAEATPTPIPSAVPLGSSANGATPSSVEPATGTTTTVSSSCTSSSSVTTSSGAPTAPSASYGATLARGATLQTKLAGWADAMNAPSGKRLATRGEILLMVDAGIFKDLQDPGAVWTASDVDTTRAWSMTLSGTMAESDKTWRLSAVYVKGVSQ